MKNYLSLTLFFLFIFFSCEEDPKVIQTQASISIIYPENNSSMVCDDEGNWNEDNMQDLACEEIEVQSECQDINSCEWIVTDYSQDLHCGEIQDQIQCQDTDGCEWLNDRCQTKEICQTKDNGCIVGIKVNIENKESADLAQILVNGSVISNGSLDTLTAYYKPPSGIEEFVNIEARLIKFDESLCGSYENENDCLSSNQDCLWTGFTCYSESFTTLASANSSININTLDSEEYFINPVFMDVNNQFSMMRFPVTNREFISFLNSNDYLEVEIVDVLWGDENGNNYGDPKECHDRDVGDQYEPTEWWYVNVKASFGNQDIPAGSYSVYKNGYNIYDTNADYSNQGGKIRYDCNLQKFYLPNEADGSESIYLDHPVTGVSWVGATIYANHFGWTLPSIEQWELAAKDNNNWIYPWGNEINENYATYNTNTTTTVGYYNGSLNLNLSLSAFGIYDMAGNVWEHTSSSTVPEIYKKVGGAFDSDTTQLKIGNTAYSIFNQVFNNTGFRCISNSGYPSSLPVGCMQEGKCNFDSFAQENSECFDDDCLNICGGTAQEFIFYEDSDGDNLGNPNSTDLQCNEPEDGWVDNDDDLIDENCPSDDINQDNIDCNIVCNGEAYIDGCGDCVGGNTNEEACIQDCNGVDNGSAERDDCDVCAGGDTGLEPNQDLDCNGICDPSTPQGQIDLENGFEFGAFVDDCNNCVEGGTGLEENYADLGCGCEQPEPEYYCLDANSNGCCDCTFDSNGGWDECNSDLDAELICEDNLSNLYINTILGCSNNNAENWYCDEDDNECIPFGVNIIPPCNFIDDGSCIVYGCSDPIADNYWDEATECDDGTIDSCCDYTVPVNISFGSITDNNIEILIDTPHDLLGFQFEVLGTNLFSGNGGIAEDAGFTVSTGGSTVLGFSFSGDIIPSGSQGVLTNLSYQSTDLQACLANGVVSDTDGNALPVIFGECYEF